MVHKYGDRFMNRLRTIYIFRSTTIFFPASRCHLLGVKHQLGEKRFAFGTGMKWWRDGQEAASCFYVSQALFWSRVFGYHLPKLQVSGTYIS